MKNVCVYLIIPISFITMSLEQPEVVIVGEVKKLTICVDFGGVISKHSGDNAEHDNTELDMENAVSSLQKLHEHHNLMLLSFCGKAKAIKSKMSIINSGNENLFDEMIFVKNTKYKNELCLHKGAHIMIDDRVDILDNIKDNNPTIKTILFGAMESDRHIPAIDWIKVMEIIEGIEYFEPAKIELTKLSKYVYDV